MWIPLATMAVSALQQNQQAQAQRKAQDQANRQSVGINAAQTQFSPWTNINPQAVTTAPASADPTGAAISGGLQGALAGAMYSKANPSAPPKPTGFSQTEQNAFLNQAPTTGYAIQQATSPEIAKKNILYGDYNNPWSRGNG